MSSRRAPRAGRRLRRAVLVVLGMIGACLSALSDARAHAIILESIPRHEESLAGPKRLVLRFNSRLEKPLCSVQLLGPRQRAIALLRQEPDAAPDTLAYALPALGPGAYQARWKVLAADGHVTEGTVRFTVMPAEPAGSR
ncbi:MAG: copper resistance CopC family protein [Candidatus Rokuibacteriota bacterium]